MREKTLIKTPWTGFGRNDLRGENEGMITQKFPGSGGSNGAMKMSDPMQHSKLQDNWYIRVPNYEDGGSRFTPPDAVKVPLREMLEIDAAEWDERRGYGRPVKKAPKP